MIRGMKLSQVFGSGVCWFCSPPAARIRLGNDFHERSLIRSNMRMLRNSTRSCQPTTERMDQTRQTYRVQHDGQVSGIGRDVRHSRQRLHLAKAAGLGLYGIVPVPTLHEQYPQSTAWHHRSLASRVIPYRKSCPGRVVDLWDVACVVGTRRRIKHREPVQAQRCDPPGNARARRFQRWPTGIRPRRHRPSHRPAPSWRKWLAEDQIKKL